MRGCLLLLVGFLFGAGLMLASWPRIPSGKSSPQSADIRIHVANGYVARVIQRRLAHVYSLHVQQVSVSSVPPHLLIARADAGAGPLAAPIAVEVQPVAQGGAAQVRVIQAQVNDVAVPSILAGRITDSINRSLRHALPPAAYVKDVVVTPDGVDLIATDG